MNNENLGERIGRRLGKLRKNRGLSQQGLSNLVYEKTGKKIARSYISTIEVGNRYKSLNTLLNTLEVLAETFSVPIEYFVGGKLAGIKGTREELEHLEDFRELLPEDRKFVKALTKRLRK